MGEKLRRSNQSDAQAGSLCYLTQEAAEGTAMGYRAGVTDTKTSVVGTIPFEDFIEREWEGLAEWVDGKVVVHPMPSATHQKLVRFLWALLQHYVEHHELGEVFAEPFIMKTGPDLPGRSPDVFFIAQQNLQRIGRNHLEGPADLALEIVSPDSPRRDRVDKFAEYQKGAVREYWIIDPLRKTADFFHLSSQGVFESMPVRNGIMLSRVLPGLWLEVEWLWQEPLPRFMEVLRRWGLV